MIDIHSHILPGIDDGAKDIKNCIDMLEIASNNGIKKIIATPHYYRGYYENNYVDICKLIENINVHKKEIDVEIFPGQEIFIDNKTLELYKQGIIRGINDTGYMLIELSMKSMPSDALDIIYELKLNGIKPIIAHPERYSYIIEKPSLINDFIDEGCLFQINGGSIEGVFGRQVHKTAEILIRNGICNFIASDAHSIGTRSPRLREAMDIVKDINAMLHDSIVDNTENLLSNAPIVQRAEKIKEKKGFFSFLKR